MISEVIGIRGSSGAFVFGVYSFLDKLTNGIVLFLITNSNSFYDATYVRLCTVIIPSASVILAWVMILVGKAKDYD